MANWKVPGVAWAALLVGLSALIQANWPSEVWAQMILIGLAAIVKALEVQATDKAQATQERARGGLWTGRTRWERWWLG